MLTRESCACFGGLQPPHRQAGPVRGKQDDPDLEQGGDANILVCLAPAIPDTGRPTRALVHC
jgi:hypothetical protein